MLKHCSQMSETSFGKYINKSRLVRTPFFHTSLKRKAQRQYINFGQSII